MTDKFLAAIRAQEIAKQLPRGRTETNSSSPPKKPFAPLTDAVRLQILTLHQNKMRGTDIARKLGLNANTVHNTIRRYGIRDNKVVNLQNNMFE